PAADRVLICEVALRNRFIDDRRWSRLGTILRVERPSGADLHPHHPKVISAHVIEKAERLSRAFRGFASVATPQPLVFAVRETALHCQTFRPDGSSCCTHLPQKERSKASPRVDTRDCCRGWPLSTLPSPQSDLH